ncbi:hypothetical protein [Magnetospirillum molischianum]|uniref:Uncharacterized protein n=1 Tax=Magnetospirillum molischianum DSM 120 TaxID=1150626 RepID=H8FQT1_MAGML|nr:hypothetical protein [Magnetospirillum molischianum]CCG40719.1 conserved exported hypothetical protein [Magnetospirillum molischianum DSM 120]
MIRVLVFVLLMLPVLSSSLLAAPKPKQCFTGPELTSEREVRHGIYLREAARRCQGRFLPDSVKTWDTFEEANGAKFRAAVARRKKAWQREFPKDWQAKQNHADGSIVTYARNIPLTDGFCENIGELLTTISKRGYGGFSAQTKIIKNEVVQSYKACQ